MISNRKVGESPGVRENGFCVRGVRAAGLQMARQKDMPDFSGVTPTRNQKHKTPGNLIPGVSENSAAYESGQLR